MSEFEKAVTGLGEECGVFGAYDVDGHDVAASVYYGLFAPGTNLKEINAVK